MSLQQILQKLISDNLHGPTASVLPGFKGNRPRSGVDEDAWIMVQDEEVDLDAKDPRWLEAFMHFFIETDSAGNDDLLFFVRAPDPSLHEPDVDPIFVKRKVNNKLPSLSYMVDWKQTFFLNLISQLPCTLTVSVCKRAPPNASDDKGDLGGGKDKSTRRTLISRRNSNDQVVVVPPSTTSEESGTEMVTGVRRPIEDAVKELEESNNQGLFPRPPPTPNSSNEPIGKAATPERSGGRSKMVALRRVCKKVYAAPYKSRMDVKDAFMNEISHPFIYYTVNDYESKDLHLPIREREYLCVELSVTAPLETESLSRSSADAAAAVTIEEDPSPFPVPPGFYKVVLFQGAVPYNSLLDVYQQKGLAAQSQVRSSWGNLSGSNSSLNSSGRPSVKDAPAKPSERTEYIMMRGPHGKGQCQVAIRQNHPEGQEIDDGSRVPTHPSPPSTPTQAPKTLSERLRLLSDTMRAGFTAITGGAEGGSIPEALKKPDSLMCSMTYVNVPWQSIISDLYEHAKQQSDANIKI
ncbi:hypothetical protein HDU76_010762 [Blyttiomyces sp. JEL0837]|nr:hypothetical protein HDU76_010762 [Blyttiomyces sp. JEL0837]